MYFSQNVSIVIRNCKISQKGIRNSMFLDEHLKQILCIFLF